MKEAAKILIFICSAGVLTGCTIKAVGDPNRPITINAHITVDINGLKNTAVNIEDFVSGKKDQLPVNTGDK